MKKTTSPSTATSTTRDEYIQVKKRIAVRADEVAMACEISDAVDLNLQKWKDTLKHLQEMENDGIPVNHPIFIATRQQPICTSPCSMHPWQLPLIHRQEVYWIFQTQQQQLDVSEWLRSGWHFKRK